MSQSLPPVKPLDTPAEERVTRAPIAALRKMTNNLCSPEIELAWDELEAYRGNNRCWFNMHKWEKWITRNVGMQRRLSTTEVFKYTEHHQTRRCVRCGFQEEQMRGDKG